MAFSLVVQSIYVSRALMVDLENSQSCSEDLAASLEVLSRCASRSWSSKSVRVGLILSKPSGAGLVLLVLTRGMVGWGLCAVAVSGLGYIWRCSLTVLMNLLSSFHQKFPVSVESDKHLMRRANAAQPLEYLSCMAQTPCLWLD